MDIRRKLLFRATSRTLQAVAAVVAEVVGAAITRLIIRRIRPVTHRRSPRVTAAAEVEEDSPIFQAFQVKSLASSAVLGSEKERDLKMHLLNRAPTPPRMHPPCHHTATDRIGLFRRSPSQPNVNLRPTHRPMHHPTRGMTLNRLEKATNLLTVSLCESSGLAAGPEDMVTLGVALGTARPRCQNRKSMKRARIRGRKIDNSDTLKTATLATLLELRRSLTLDKGLGSEPCTRFHDRRKDDDLMGLDRGEAKRIDPDVLEKTCAW